MDTTTRVRTIVAPLVADAGASLYDLEYTGGVVRVTIERPEGVDMALIAKVTRDISRTLDDEDPIAGQYTLEVSSPGLERPLRRPEHYLGAVGTLVALKLRAGVEGDRRVKGVLLGFADDLLTVAPADADPGATRTIALDDVEKARTVFEWGPAPKPGGKPAGKAAPKGTSAKNKSAEKKAATS
jgi:ribosome maturation factor RimP